MKRVHVVAAVIRSDMPGGQSNKILLAKRLARAHQGGKWEFPGGKVEAGESAPLALERELREELNIDAQEYLPLIQVQYDYPDKSVFLDVWEVLRFVGEPQGMEGQQVQWVHQDELSRYEFPAANVPIVTAAQLPSRYWITPEPKAELAAFYNKIEAQIRSGIKLVQLRVKDAPIQTLLEIVTWLSELQPTTDASFYINGDSYLQLRSFYGDGDNPSVLCETFSGIHLTSSQLQRSITFPADLPLVASCHTLEDIKAASEIGCAFVTLSPIKKTDSHPLQEPLDENALRDWVRMAKLPVYALGGMSNEDIPAMRALGFQGVAGISKL